MKSYLKAKLEETIQTWTDEHCGTEQWPEHYMGGKTIELMVEAAAAVFDAVMEFQKYARQEGLFEK